MEEKCILRYNALPTISSPSSEIEVYQQNIDREQKDVQKLSKKRMTQDRCMVMVYQSQSEDVG